LGCVQRTSISNNGLILAIAQFDAGAPEYVELALREPGAYALVGLGLLLAAAVKRRSQYARPHGTAIAPGVSLGTLC